MAADNSNLLTYQGNAGLGVGASDISVGAPNNYLATVIDTGKNIRNLNFERNFQLFNQKVKDRDQLLELIAKNQVASGELDPQYRAVYDKAEKEQQDAFNAIQGINDAKGIQNFMTKTRQAKELADHGQLNTLMLKKLQAEKATKTLPREVKAYDEFINKEKEKVAGNYWEMVNPYQQQFDFTTEPILKSAKFLTSATPATEKNPYDTTVTAFDFKGTDNTLKDLYIRDADAAQDMRQLLNEFQSLPPADRTRGIQAINAQIDKHNKELGLVEGTPGYAAPVKYEPGVGLIQEMPADFAAKYALAHQDKFTSTETKPNKEFAQLDINRGTLAEKIRDNKAKNAIEWAKIGIAKKKADAQITLWNKKTMGTADAKGAALDFATNLYKQMNQLADKNGVITPDKVRGLTNEQLRYLGIYQQVTDKNGETIKGLNPLTLEDGSMIQLDNGKIKVMKEAKFDPKINRWIGKWDNTKTTTITNIATNRVNEENQLSTGKEINQYLPLDSGDEDIQYSTPQLVTDESLIRELEKD